MRIGRTRAASGHLDFISKVDSLRLWLEANYLVPGPPVRLLALAAVNESCVSVSTIQHAAFGAVQSHTDGKDSGM
jgi:hypothetical protein